MNPASAYESSAERWRVAVIGQAETIASSLRALAAKIEFAVSETSGPANAENSGALEHLVDRVKLQVDLGTGHIERQLILLMGAWRFYRMASTIGDRPTTADPQADPGALISPGGLIEPCLQTEPPEKGPSNGDVRPH